MCGSGTVLASLDTRLQVPPGNWDMERKQLARQAPESVPLYSKLPSFALLGGDQDLLLGYVSGAASFVVPDTGSDIMVMSAAYATQLGLPIFREKRHRTKRQLIDGSEIYTSGLVTDVEWSFFLDGPTPRHDFHVIEDLPVDVIVSNDFLLKHDVFSEYESSILEWTPKEDEAGIYGITLVENMKNELRSLEEHAQQDRESPCQVLHFDRLHIPLADAERA